MRRFSACIEWLFSSDNDHFTDRIRKARHAGLGAVEFWRWTDKDLDAIETALAETGLALTAIVAEPMIALTDPANRQRWLDGLRASIAVAERLGARVLIAQAGSDLAGNDLAGDSQTGPSRAEQRRALVTTLRDGADCLRGTGIRLGLEPLNTIVDHAGYFLPSTHEALDIIDEIGRPEIGIVYDIYHSAVMGERTRDVLADRIDRIVHVHVADHPGRNEPGTGTIDLADRLDWLFANGYDRAVGLEYRPTRSSGEAVAAVVASLDR